jgi:polyhydroxybutyrate depolymerase
MKRKHLITSSLLALFVMLQAQDINLSGKVINKNSVPIQNANVSLKNAKKTTSTNAEGKFTFSPTVNVKAVLSSLSEYVVSRSGVIHVKTKGSETGEIAIYDYTGKKIVTLFSGTFHIGDNAFNFSKKTIGLADRFYIFNVNIGDRSVYGRFYAERGRLVICELDKSVKNDFMAKAMAGIDQLTVSAAGYRDTVLAIEKYIGNLDDIVLSSGGGCVGGGWTAGDRTITFTYGKDSRKFEVHIPKSYTGDMPVPLMMTIHGAHNTIAMVKSWSQMNPLSDANGFIVVYPQGIDCWNCGFSISGCPVADDDVGFLRAVVDTIQKHACIDPKRIYATGISNGSMMTAYLGCKAADLFAAVGGVSGGVSGTCSPSRPISYFYVHGTKDGTIPYSSAQPNVDGWVKRDGCNSTPIETYNVGSTRCVTYKGCKDSVEVVFCTVTGMNHCWPEDKSCLGTNDNPGDFKMSPMNWEFFKRFTLP